MFLSVFDIFKIGIGPSSSHTMGPMVAACRFLSHLREKQLVFNRFRVSLHGSLALTGIGHASDRAVLLGLCGYEPHTLDPDQVESLVDAVHQTKCIQISGGQKVWFDPKVDLVLDFDVVLPHHSNGMVFRAYNADGGIVHQQIYYSIGGGFVKTAEEFEVKHTDQLKFATEGKTETQCPYPFTNAAEMLEMGLLAGKSISRMKMANEVTVAGTDIEGQLDTLWAIMDDCIDRGLSRDGVLPGGLNVQRRARNIHNQLQSEKGLNQLQPHVCNDWLSVYAMAVNEENASGGRVVTAPTNGASGVIPAVIRYYRDHCIGSTREGIQDCLLAAAAIGGIIKRNSSISGAEVGCQGEVGSASAMAAAGLCAALKGTNSQIENAAEIALEHHLGMTCDPAAGLVQVPCIERNGLGAIKAVSAASLALRGDGSHFLPLDNCIETMRQTGLDMNQKYKETSRGGIAVNLPEC